LPDSAVQVVVVDNSEGHGAAPIHAEYVASGRFKSALLHEPRRGVSHARNAGLSWIFESRCEFIAFIDDDETPSPDWLEALLRTARTERVAAVMGPVEPVFDGCPPRWAVLGAFYEKRLGAAEGERLKDGYTSNCLVSTAALRRHGLSFDPSFNESGGEDTILFKQLIECGEEIAWSRTAAVAERIPVARQRLSWLLKRWFRTGGVEAHLGLYAAGSFRGRAWNGARGSARIAVGLARLLLCLLSMRRSHIIVAQLYTISRGLGLVAASAGLTYKEYTAPGYA
jgi:cellulose synthase/poly-beta-1,6-N-acetylglucosamine synthase-like glycosyltransferase